MTKIVNSRYNRHTIYSMLEVFYAQKKIKTLKLKILKKKLRKNQNHILLRMILILEKGFLVNLLLHIEQLMQYYLF
jgi:hypothetical protein